MINKERYKELASIACDVIDFLEKQGVKREEGCLIQRMANDLWYTEQTTVRPC